MRAGPAGRDADKGRLSIEGPGYTGAWQVLIGERASWAVFALRGYMRAAVLLSAMFVIGGGLAALGYPVMYIAGRPLVGVSGLLFALFVATLPPLLVFWFRWLRRM